MDLRQLEIVRAIAETGSFTGAGARLHVSQSAISRQILLLEEEFRERLFVRLGRRVQITAAGEVLLQLSHRVFSDIRDTSASITDRQKVLSGPLGRSVCCAGCGRAARISRCSRCLSTTRRSPACPCCAKS
jgi:DNA-binding transcriptional LysR family regulator